ncbi:MAG: hypothetical protein H7839_15010 [Magnetococcus sp. YQC-5]
MDIETLYPLVTEAILRAEMLAENNDPASQDAYCKVSQLEEQITKLIPASDREGVIARRGAVSAAIVARQYERAEQLVTQFTHEKDADDDLKESLKNFIVVREITINRTSFGFNNITGPV